MAPDRPAFESALCIVARCTPRSLDISVKGLPLLVRPWRALSAPTLNAQCLIGDGGDLRTPDCLLQTASAGLSALGLSKRDRLTHNLSRFRNWLAKICPRCATPHCANSIRFSANSDQCGAAWNSRRDGRVRRVNHSVRLSRNVLAAATQQGHITE